MATPDSISKSSSARRLVTFKDEFDRLAVNGAIGFPNGKAAYAYLRVSSDEQAEEGSSGLPRQIEHVHQKALETGYCISWERVYADDFTGFQLERPELSRLRNDYRSAQRTGTAVVMEHLDRLSRNSDWHQGFLLDEMKQAGIEPVFWKSFASRIERTVMGAVAQEASEQAKERQMEGKLRKARSGRVTAHSPAYGYRLVDDSGNESARARKHSYYALHEENAPIVRMIYQRVASGETLNRVASDLTAMQIPPPRKNRSWDNTVLRLILKNPVYKGEFIAHRWIDVKIQKPSMDGLSTRTVTHRQQRPEEEWIRVPVPAVVDAATWQAANDMLEKNKRMASRNASEPYLLTGLITCADCGYSYRGLTHKKVRGKLRDSPYRGYCCSNSSKRPKYLRWNTQCKQSYVTTKVLDTAVWSVVCKALLEPDILLQALRADVFNDQNAQLERQITYLEREIENKQVEDQKLYKAYLADVFNETEYAERRKQLKFETAQLQTELTKLYPLRVSKDYFETQQAIVLEFAERLRSMNSHVDPPFELKQRIIKMTVNQVVLNSREKWFRLEGTIRGLFSIDSIPVGRDSLLRLVESLLETSASLLRG